MLLWWVNIQDKVTVSTDFIMSNYTLEKTINHLEEQNINVRLVR